MSPKELLYIEDALNHESFLKTQCQECANQLSDPVLKNFVNELCHKRGEIFNELYRTL
ncbi:MAG: hypothetical protein PHD46_05480 [Eubacteriales bacterium]|nr:hypothetical protein [Eubacteriales bacterium]MDD4422469.1 hypothetical protein [Eubacteriales bacterium]